MDIGTGMNEQSAITRGRKFEQVRDGASTVFMREGYAAASVDEIARAANVSKATLYSYFPDKRLMFQEVLRTALERGFRDTVFSTDDADDPATTLPAVLTALAGWLISDLQLSLHRVVVAEATRFPDIAAAYADAVLTNVIRPLAELIDGWIATSQIVPHDTDQSARQLMALISGQLQPCALLSERIPDDARIAQVGCSTAILFLNAYARRAA